MEKDQKWAPEEVAAIVQQKGQEILSRELGDVDWKVSGKYIRPGMSNIEGRLGGKQLTDKRLGSDLGFDSVTIQEFIGELNTTFGIKLPETIYLDSKVSDVLKELAHTLTIEGKLKFPPRPEKEGGISGR